MAGMRPRPRKMVTVVTFSPALAPTPCQSATRTYRRTVRRCSGRSWPSAKPDDFLCQTRGQPGPRWRWGGIHKALCAERIRRTPHLHSPGRCAKSAPAPGTFLPSQYPRPRVRHLWPYSSEAVRHAGLPLAGSRWVRGRRTTSAAATGDLSRPRASGCGQSTSKANVIKESPP
jgi:hypothetical protein